jgi:hypothetical protein
MPGYHAAVAAMTALGIDKGLRRDGEFTVEEAMLATGLGATAIRSRLRCEVGEGKVGKRKGTNESGHPVTFYRQLPA